MKLFVKLFAVAALGVSLHAQGDTPKAGVVVMHGKGGSPSMHVSELAASLERDGFLVANLDMPWSGQRNYDVDVATAENEVEAALTALRQKGAGKVFVAGHSQGGVFALYFGGRHRVDGVVAIAPGGNVGNATFRETLGPSVEQARNLVAEGKGQEKARFSDYESGKGTFAVTSTPAAYLSWFEPEGAMNQALAMRSIKADTPVLYVAPTGDYPALVRVKQEMFGMLAKHPLTRMVEPASSHLNAPSASVQEIERWINSVSQQ
ncbi:alpha/beta hydrolase [Pseudogulbenkiania subflava]|uniref:Alpha/beta hydrolase family protein n=1 Tax=Pseudogulbenkiania subflava DSM 22618 TaxID=1123014 RepID=A0A1Y6B6Q7_9NEIS|nr:alpha/beta hydrolase [Pseudogulbenkiania subflava]SME94953.1 Alpha/beta hydrolase family protein [Pseudogulbenkiania subflava DSM 22618]